VRRAPRLAAGLAATVLALTPALWMPVGGRPVTVDVAIPMEWPDDPPPRPTPPPPPPPQTPTPWPLGPGCPTCWN
jgi:hypothetical protein